MSAIEPPPVKSKRPKCGYSHDEAPHKGEGAVVQCRDCEKWLVCKSHYTYTSCRTERVRFWNLKLTGRIKAYLKRGDTDGEAE